MRPQTATDYSQPPPGLRSLGIGSILFGILGGAFCWWLPLGMVLSITGLLLGLADWGNARRRSLNYWLSLTGMAVSLACLALDIVFAALGLQTVTFGGM